MLNSVEGIYRDGMIELLEFPVSVKNDTYVIVTFLQSGQANLIDLKQRGINAVQAADLRGRLASFTEEWEAPEMEIYNDYDRTKAGV